MVSSATRFRGKTISDDNLPANFQSPTKLLAQRETQKLKHSSSVADLKHSLEDSPKHSNAPSHGSLSLRPKSPMPRRRSTLRTAGTAPEVRQQELQELLASTMADTMFTLHCKGIEQPVYISEVFQQSLNPSYQFFDLNELGPGVLRSDEVTVKLWAKAASVKDFEALVWLNANLQSLQFIGRSLENFYHPLPENCVLFHLTDGIYTSFIDMPAEFYSSTPLAVRPSKAGALSPQFTASYDVLMRLANLDECIQDALATRQRLEAHIESVLEQHRQPLNAEIEVERARESSTRTKKVVGSTNADIATKQHDILSLRERSNGRRETMSRGRQIREQAIVDHDKAQKDVERCKVILSQINEETHGQIRRIGEDLSSIFPIEPIPGRPLNFTIRGLLLPNSTFDEIDRDITAAALGYTAQLVHLLSQYLAVPLPYPVQARASQSSIQDPISAGIGQRIFPLHPSSIQYRFEYGVFLLNKDIEFLMTKYGLKMLDIRHTLPNLKYLLYVMTAGTKEIPLRKAGGVKALITGRISPSMSRRASEESVSSTGDTVYSRPTIPNHGSKTTLHLSTGERKEKEDLEEFSRDGVTPGNGTFKRSTPFKTSNLRESF